MVVACTLAGAHQARAAAGMETRPHHSLLLPGFAAVPRLGLDPLLSHAASRWTSNSSPGKWCKPLHGLAKFSYVSKSSGLTRGRGAKQVPTCKWFCLLDATRTLRQQCVGRS